MRADRRSTRPGAEPPFLSLAMIVRDGAADLPRCLASVRGLADEVVVVDTGSLDESRELATAAGARVFDVPWTDDFAAARNASVQRCRGRWILILDADEALPPAGEEPLRAWVREHDERGDLAALALATRNYLPVGLKRRGWTHVPSPDPFALATGPPAPGYVVTTKVRLFPRHPAVRFRGCLHETVEASLDALGLPIESREVPVHHFGTLRVDPAKQLMYRKLAGRKTREAPNDAGAWAELADCCLVAGDRKAALDAIDRAVRLSCGRPDYALTAGLLWLETGAAGRAEALLNLAVSSPRLPAAQRAEALHALARAALYHDRLQQAGDLLDGALRLTPRDGQVWNTLGVLAIRGRRGSDAHAALVRACELLPADAAPFLNLGILHQESGHGELAIPYLRLALEHDPGCSEAERRLSQLLPPI